MTQPEIKMGFGDAVRQNFHIEPAGLAADEAFYLLNFKDADAIRNRAIAAVRQRNARLRAKGVRASAESRLGGAERDRLRRLLDAAAAEARSISFWWRDDDAFTVTPELARLLALSARYAAPLALAVIPKNASTALAERLHEEARVGVLQHGWRHRRHSPAGEKKMELGDHRPLPEILAELRAGFDRLSGLFDDKFLPVLVPPWNRIGVTVDEARGSVGLVGLSLFGRESLGRPHCVNTHIDIIDWTNRAAKPSEEVYALISDEIEQRLAGSDEPIGILSHHLVHDEPAWSLLAEILELLADHPAAAWPTVPTLFSFRR